jgi:hypothetical protein
LTTNECRSASARCLGVGAEGERLQDVEGQLLKDLQVGGNEHEECCGEEALPRIRHRLALVCAAMVSAARLP